MSDIKTTVFPNGAPCDSILDVHNNNIFRSDKIAAVYLANGRPVANLFHENSFNLIGTKNITDLVKFNKLEKFFVPDELQFFSQIKTNPIENILILSWKMVNTGVINVENVDNILSAIMISMSSGRILYFWEVYVSIILRQS